MYYSVKQDAVDEEDFPAPKPVKVRPVIGPPAPVKQHRITAAELFTPSEASSPESQLCSLSFISFSLTPKDPRGQFLFFQLPDSLPVARATIKEEPMEVEGASSQTVSTDEVPTPVFDWGDILIYEVVLPYNVSKKNYRYIKVFL